MNCKGTSWRNVYSCFIEWNLYAIKHLTPGGRLLVLALGGMFCSSLSLASEIQIQLSLATNEAVVPVAGALIPARYWLSAQESGTLWFYPSKPGSTDLWHAEMLCPPGATQLEVAVASAAFKDLAGNLNPYPIQAIVVLTPDTPAPTARTAPEETPTPAITAGATTSRTSTPTATSSFTPTYSATPTDSSTCTETATLTATATRTETPSPTYTETLTATASYTPTPTPTAKPPVVIVPDLNIDGRVDNDDLCLLLHRWPERAPESGRLTEQRLDYADVFSFSAWWGARTPAAR